MTLPVHIRNRYPYYHLVPKTRDANLEFRRKLLELSKTEKDAHDLWLMCSRDLLFFVNAFGWTYDNRLVDGYPDKLFLTYPIQDEALLTIEDCIGREDLWIEKSRAVGATWLCLMAFLHKWLFRDGLSFLLVSRNEDYVDAPGDPKTLFWKLDFLLQRLPRWLRPRFTRTALMLVNDDNGSTLSGESTTGDVGKGGRFTAMLLDEFAAVAPVSDGFRAATATQLCTHCRIFNSTHQGTHTAFYMMGKQCERKLRLHWSDIPPYAEDLHRDADGKLTSSWYERECRRAGCAAAVAQELDINVLASASQYFNEKLLNECAQQFVSPPAVLGMLELERGRVRRIIKGDSGPLNLWVFIDERDRLISGRTYVIGADIAAGTEASNSVLCVLCTDTGEQIAEYVTCDTAPDRFADIAVALAHWFHGPDGEGALLIWDGFGPTGAQFGRAVRQLGYGRIYMSRDERRNVPKATDRPGFFGMGEARVLLLANFASCLRDRKIQIKSAETIEEAREYIYLPDRTVEFARAAHSKDPSGAKSNHGDRVMAAALAAWVLQSSRPYGLADDEPPRGSLAWRIKQGTQKKTAEVYNY